MQKCVEYRRCMNTIDVIYHKKKVKIGFILCATLV